MARLPSLAVLLGMAAIVISCKREKNDVIPDDISVSSIEQVLNSGNISLIQLLDRVRGSVGRRGPGSKTIWSRKNEYGLGLYVSANHVYGINTWSSRSAQSFDLYIHNSGIFETSQIPPASGSISLGKTLSADFPLLHFNISPNVTDQTIHPLEDFYLGVIDNQRTEQAPVAKYPSLVQTGFPLQMYDPFGRTKATRTWADPIAGEQAIAIGYPRDQVNYPNGAVCYGKILSDIEAEQVMLKLKIAGDSEATVTYRPQAEFFVDAAAVAGMSGGGVFNAQGQLLGIMVRASNHRQGPKIIRVVKMSFIKSRLMEFYESLPQQQKLKIEPFIGDEL